LVYTISYELNRPGKDYPKLYETIKALGAWWHPVDATWYVDIRLTAVQVRDSLQGVVNATDQILVSTAVAPAAWTNLDDSVSNWLKGRLK
jgi:hypothetical protein